MIKVGAPEGKRGTATDPIVWAEADVATRSERIAAMGSRCFMARVYHRSPEDRRSEGPEVTTGKGLGFTDAKA